MNRARGTSGGFGSAVADALTAHGGQFTIRQMFVPRIPKSGRPPDDLLHYLRLSAENITKVVMEEFFAPILGNN